MNSGRGVDDDVVVRLFEFLELANDVRLGGGGTVGQVGQSAGARKDVDTVGALQNDVSQGSRPGKDVRQVPVAVEAAQQVDVPQAQVRVEQAGSRRRPR